MNLIIPKNYNPVLDLRDTDPCFRPDHGDPRIRPQR